MESIALEAYADFIRTSSAANLRSATLPGELMITSQGDNQTFYAPFDYINQKAKIVIVGITPGLQQASNALMKAKEVLETGGDVESAKEQAKIFASFSGAMRNNLTAMMDYVGLNDYLNIESTMSLFDEHQDKVHFTSALRYPVFKQGKNFNESPLKLKEQVMAWFAEECKILSEAVYIPLGPKVVEVLELMVELDILKPGQVLSGLQHPSGANAERIAYFLGKKAKENLSIKTNPDKIDKAKQIILDKMSILKNSTLTHELI